MPMACSLPATVLMLEAEKFEGLRWNDRGFEEPYGGFQNLRHLLS